MDVVNKTRVAKELTNKLLGATLPPVYSSANTIQCSYQQTIAVHVQTARFLIGAKHSRVYSVRVRQRFAIKDNG